MTTDAEHAARNQQMVMLALGITAAKALARNRIILLVGLIAGAQFARRKGAAMSVGLRRRMATNLAAWRHS
jgi:hypothetical protein